MSHRKRLSRLEDQFKPGAWRCDACHQWSDVRVEYGPTYQAINGPPIDYPPEECDNCGYRPQVITVEYTEHWRAS